MAKEGGYVACQSAAATGMRPSEGGWSVVEKDSGDAARILPLDEGREPGGEWCRCIGSFGDGAWCSGEAGLEVGCELVGWPGSRGADLDSEGAPSKDDEEDGGERAYGLLWGEAGERPFGDGRCADSRRGGSGVVRGGRVWTRTGSRCRSLLTKL